ncbi:MAG TPA: hypothetical protein DEP42_06315, partial [Ruminococcaceae bacterium]|nr:hypothetical protein [Oscillospiraceae bacterium]
VLLFIGFSRVHLSISFTERFDMEVRFWFFRYRFFKENAAEKPSSRKKKEKKSKKEKKKAESKGRSTLSFFLSHFSDFAGLLKQIAVAVGRRLRVDLFLLELDIHEEDAAKTAIRYGEACALIYTGTAFLESVVRVRKHNVRITPLFQEGETQVNFSSKISISIGSIVTLIATQGVTIIKTLISIMRSTKDAAIQKDGAVT